MSTSITRLIRSAPYVATALVVFASLLADTPVSSMRQSGGCFGGGFGRQSVGGVAIDTNGLLSNVDMDELHRLREVRQRMMHELSTDITQPTALRKISLRKLDKAISEQIASGKPISPELAFLAGIQKIQYVFVYPEQQDIVIAGFGEGWKVDDRGNMVGLTTGDPVMVLDDLLVVLRNARQSAQQGITCSIDPTPEGMARLQAYVNTLKSIGDPAKTIANIEEALGPQKITVGGIPETSHFARVLVAADYRMKRIGMGFEPSPVAGLKSYISMIPAGGSGMQNMTPRWWMVPNYQPMLTDGQGLAWELRGGSVKTLTEDSYMSAAGAKPQAGKTSPVAQRWADAMTTAYPALADKEPIFGQLRNCMDLAIVAALIEKEHLMQKAGVKFTALTNPEEIRTIAFEAPKTTASKVSFEKKGSNWVISASGGVEIQPLEFLQKPETSADLAPARTKAESSESKNWWWN